MDRRIRGLILPGLLTLAGFGVLVGLGAWQVERMGAKQRLIDRVEARLTQPAVPLPPEPPITKPALTILMWIWPLSAKAATLVATSAARAMAAVRNPDEIRMIVVLNGPDGRKQRERRHCGVPVNASEQYPGTEKVPSSGR